MYRHSNDGTRNRRSEEGQGTGEETNGKTLESRKQRKLAKTLEGNILKIKQETGEYKLGS